MTSGIGDLAAPSAGDHAYLFPLSLAQERLWFLDRLQPYNSAYNVPLVLPIKVPLSTAVLSQTINEIVRRHEILRTIFVVVDDEPRQVVLTFLDIALATVDLTGEPANLRETEAQRLTLIEMQRPFDLANGPLLRATLIKLAEANHVLVLTMHHIVCDGWSMGVLLRELSVLYEAFGAGRPSPLPELPIQYADFACWQRERLTGELLEEEIAHWKARLTGAPALLDLPTDRPHPAVQSFRGAWYPFALSSDLTQRLSLLSREAGTTLFMTLLAAFATLLHRYARVDDIVIGSPIANRSRPELEGLIGFFTNTIVLRTDFRRNPSFRELLRQVREVTLDAYTHQELPFEKLVEELQPERNLAYNPIFQVMFSMQNASPGQARSGAVAQDALDTQQGHPSAEAPPAATSAKFDLTLSIMEGDASLTASLEYNTDLFDHETAKGMARQFAQLLKHAVSAPDTKVSELSLLGPADRGCLLDGPQTAAAASGRPLLNELFERQAAATPDAVAVASATRRLTYAALDRASSLLARQLRDEGVGPETLVGICIERSPEMIVGLLAILKAGGAYVPLDQSYPPARLGHMLSKARPKLILAHRPTLEHPAFAGMKVIDVEAVRPIPQLRIDDDCAELPAPDNACYVIFTSGSTGQPKGVVVTHHSAVNHMLWMKSAWPLDADCKILQKTPISFDASVWEIFLPLICGAKLYLAGPEDHRDAAAILHTVVAEGITDLQLVPSMLDLLLVEPELDRCTKLKRLYLGGEAVSRSLVERFARRSAAQVVNLYGPTEATIQAVTTAAGSSDKDRGTATIPIGTPIDNAKAYILDAHLRPVAPGIAGELYLGGSCLARGYIGDPKQTADRFIPNPFGSAFGERLYRTGDIVRLRSSGKLDFIGRNDQQIKIRGQRVELAEIEAVILRFADAIEAVVEAREYQPGDVRIVAYVVLRAGDKAAMEQALHSHLRSELPKHMIPFAIVGLEQLPRLPNGKLDRRALPVPDFVAPARDRAHVAPRTSLEAALVDIWQTVLGVTPISMLDNFFELGGHSLLATQVFSRIRDTLQAELPLRLLFVSPTIAGLAESALAHVPDPEILRQTAQLVVEMSTLSDEAVAQKLLELEQSTALPSQS